MNRIKKLTDMQGTQIYGIYNIDNKKFYIVGWDNVESITLYNENGSMAPIAYLCIKFTTGKELRTSASNYEIEIDESNL